MRKTTLTLVVIAVAAALSSCQAPPPVRANVEEVMRGPAVSPLPDVGESEYIRAAQRDKHGYPSYHHGGGYNRY